MKKLILPALLLVFAGAYAQQGKALAVTDYERAEKFMGYNTSPLVDGANVRPNWLAADKFWYRNLTAKGSEYIMVDAVKGSRTVAFDHQKFAEGLAKATNAKYDANTLPAGIGFTDDGKYATVYAGNKNWKYDLAAGTFTEDTGAAQPARGGFMGRRGGAGGVASPDGKRTAFIKDYNLWVRDVATGKQIQLTTDGEKDFGYATDNAGWSHSDVAILQWSPDSKKIATFKQDQRKVGDMYLVTTNVGAPTLKAWKYPLPGDKEIAMIHRCIIEVDNPKVIMLKVPADPHRATLSDDISSSGTLDDVNWSADGTQLAFVSTSRDHKQEKVRIANAATGDVREVFEEVVNTQYESGWGSINWRYLPKSNEIIWFSERDNWGHLYLYNAATGKLKNQITKGDWVVTRLLKVDEKSRTLYFVANGKDKLNPYFSHIFKIGFDGKKLTDLTPDAGFHQVTFSPSGNYLVDTYSQPNVAPVTVLRNLNGKLITTVQQTDISRLTASGWKAPTPITVKAADGKTDLYGLMFTPTHLDANQKYPIINYLYPGPQGGSMGGNWGFSAARGDHQALAELGFVVVLIEGTSNPLRSKSFHDMAYGKMSDNTLPDQVSGMQQLAQKYPYIDINRAGMWGHSGGGFATACAMFKYPDFFKVGISESGNHDNRNYEDDWGERYIGLLTKDANGVSNYEDQANQNFAKNLKGKLMLAHGMMDDNVPPYNTLLVVEALEKAGKDYDLVIFPNSAHGYGQYSNYMTRRRWDYFVRYLMGAETPKEYQLKPKVDAR
ncbi:S9 family peptidase [Mucilaginibacter terrae]|uniref:Dipeptidyl aminopeptidase/acylaminoacyl peptidase n=1 Tax=Mucilaginibacter terrae TaxID=1955052 RepID=A0ABU3GU34_9SPHI|nr:DPP IV N-terminal domain-containing protein [Mucilaginibacter terrae]MDT3403076.1 dipeptidyl aminopeptidase/acylaminoacyl peptidase [Mucilaginibacter terrae]